MEKEILKVLVNRYMIQLKKKDGQDFLYTDQKVEPETMTVLKKHKEQIIDYIKQQDKIETAKKHVAFLASFLDTLEEERAKSNKDVLDVFMNGDSKECAEILDLIEKNKKLYPEDSARAEVYKAIRDKACKMAKHYDDLYFTVIGDKYVDDVVVAPVAALGSIKDEFETKIEGYHMFKHDDHPDV